MTKNIAKSISKQSKRDLVAEDLVTITKLVATLPSDRDQLDDDTLFRLANLQHCALFFCPTLTQISDRAAAVHAASKKMKVASPIRRKDFEALCAGKPLSLDKVVSVHQSLRAIARSRDPAIRSTINMPGKGRVKKTLVLGENDIIPSLFWVNKAQVDEFIKAYGIKRRRLGKLIFGDNPQTNNIMIDLNKGAVKAKVRYDYRITDFTCEYIYVGLNAIFNRLPRFGRPPMVMPPRSQFFVLSHTVGAGQGRRKLALPISKGNKMTALTPLEQAQIEARVEAYATTIEQ